MCTFQNCKPNKNNIFKDQHKMLFKNGEHICRKSTFPQTHLSLISFKGSSALKGDGPLLSSRAVGQNNLLRLLRAKKVVLFHMNLKLKE